MKNPTKENIKLLYGDFGVDLFEGKRKPPLVKQKKESKNPIVKIIDKIKDYFSSKAEFEPDDTMYWVVNKYIFNEKKGFVKDIETKFGKKGMEVFGRLERMGYVE